MTSALQKMITRFGCEIELRSLRPDVDVRVLLAHAGQVVSREEILREVWNDPEMKTSKTLDMHMSWLRRKLASARSTPDTGSPISTVRGVGFRFDA